ncbi:MAG: 30S ribosomal protein S4 [Planctomycetes bacterium]|nr:30S ribosomal protein S4 [Planctomycetota bacterium]
MARILGPKCRLCRRDGQKLFLKGTRCETAKCPVSMDSSKRRQRIASPGQHGAKRSQNSDYGIHLREKQRAKRYYGIMDRQFKHYFETANKMPGNTGENLLILLERRLDNVVYQLKLAPSHSMARQLARHGHITVNNKKVSLPSYLVKAGDVIKLRKEKSTKAVKPHFDIADKTTMPSWLKIDDTSMEGHVVQLPTRSEVALPINEQLIVEFLSR